MKTVITATGNELSSLFDKRFGRAGWFCVLDSETGKTQFHKNENKDAQGGAGTKTVEYMVELGVTKVISGDFGPKAKDLLDKFNIQMVIIQDDELSIDDIIRKIK